MANVKNNLPKILEDLGCENVKKEKSSILFSKKGVTQKWDMEIELSNDFPLNPPEIILQKHLCTKHRPHVGWNRIICLTDKEGLSYDFSEEIGIIDWAINKAVEILDEGEKTGLDPFLDEFEGYWEGYCHHAALKQISGNIDFNEIADVYLDFDEKFRVVRVSTDNFGFCVSFFKKHQDFPNFSYPPYKSDNLEKDSNFPAQYIPFDSLILPPLPEKIWSTQDIYNLIDNLGEIQKKRASKFIKKKNKNLYLIFSQKRPSGGRSAFAVSIEFHHQEGLFGKLSTADKINFYGIRRLSPDFLCERGCNYSSVKGKRVAILGCGAVGSHIGIMIAQAGVKNLTLVDKDTFEPENLYRHSLPSRSLQYPVTRIKIKGITPETQLRRNKATLLSQELLNRFPHIKCKADSPHNALQWFTETKISNFDLVIVALGNPLIERELNKRLFSFKDHKTKVLFTWLEPLGLGGHIVLTDGENKGCVDCLYHKQNTFQPHPYISFIEENQQISRNLTGCIGSFTPFSSLDAQQTSLLASRAAIYSLEGMYTNRYDCWTGSPQYAIEANVKISKTFDKIQSQLSSFQKEFLESGCPVCNPRNPFN